MQRIFDISGMTCSACSAHVQKAVEKLNGVEKASVNLLTNAMKVTFDEERLSADEIVAAVEKSGYGASVREDGETRENDKQRAAEFKKKDAEKREYAVRLSVSIAFTLVLMYFSMGSMVGAPLPVFMQGESGAVAFAFTQMLLCLPVIYVNFVYFKNGFKRLFTLSPNMDSLIALGSAVSFLYGVFAIYRMSWGMGSGNIETVHRYMHELYFESAAMILTLITLGKFFEEKSKRRTTGAVEKLKQLVPPTAILFADGKEISVDSASLKEGDVAVLKAGAKIPCDGRVLSGEIFADESAITGESMPVSKTTGAVVTGGTTVSGGYAKIKVSGVGEKSVIASIIRLVQDANAEKAPIAKLADKISGIFVPVVIGIALITFAVWLICGQSAEFAMSLAISVLVISCPCALGLATPVAVMVGTGKGAENGVLFKSGEALQTLHGIKTVIFDKTGTITYGKPSVTDFMLFSQDADREKLLQAVGYIESKSEHPLGKAIAQYALEKGKALNTETAAQNSDRLSLTRATDKGSKKEVSKKEAVSAGALKAENFKTHSGKGVSADVNRESYLVGNAALMKQFGVEVGKAQQDRVQTLAAEGKTPMLIAVNKELRAVIAVADTVKPTSAAAISQLKRAGVHTVMLTGDNLVTAKAVAKSVGVDEVFAEVLPAEKEEVVKRFMKKGATAMVGDGINDAPALTRADVGIAVGAGADIALDSADVILIKNDLSDVATAVRLSKATIRNVKQNLFWAFFYNALCIPLAAGIFYVPFNIKLNPMIGAAAMSVSSLFVVGNALRLKFFRAKTGGDKRLSDAALSPQNESGEEKTINNNQKTAASGDGLKERTVMKYKMYVGGMSCNHCKARVEKALAQTGIEAVVNLEGGFAEFESDGSADMTALKDAVVNAGYEVGEIVQA